MGYIISGIKNSREVKVGDTITRRKPQHRSDSRFRGCETDGLRGRLSRGGRPVRRPARLAGEAPAQRRLAHVRPGKLPRPRIRFPLRLPRPAPHGNHPGAPLPRIRHGRHHHRTQCIVPGDDEKGRNGLRTQSFGAAGTDHGGQNRGTIHRGPNHYQERLLGQRHQGSASTSAARSAIRYSSRKTGWR